METIIVLEGDQKRGKSTTIRKVYRLLLDGSLYRQRVSVSVLGKLGPKETSAIITVDGVKIGIESFSIWIALKCCLPNSKTICTLHG
jgi:hypothetical protein